MYPTIVPDADIRTDEQKRLTSFMGQLPTPGAQPPPTQPPVGSIADEGKALSDYMASLPSPGMQSKQEQQAPPVDPSRALTDYMSSLPTPGQPYVPKGGQPNDQRFQQPVFQQPQSQFNPIQTGQDILAAPAEVVRAGFNATGDTSMVSPGQKIVNAFQSGDQSQPADVRLRNALQGASSGFEQSLAAAPQYDPSGGLISGMGGATARLATEPMLALAPEALPASSLAGAGAAGLGLGAVNLAQGASPEQVAQSVETGANLGMIGGPIAKAVGPTLLSGAGKGLLELGKVGAPGMTIQDVSGQPSLPGMPESQAAAPKGPVTRVPIWMKPVEDAQKTLPPESQVPLSPSQSSAVLPSGRTPGQFGQPRAPLVVEDAMTPLERAVAKPQERTATRLANLTDTMLRQAYDRLYPLRALDEAAGLGPNTGSHATAQVVSGAVAAGEDNLRRQVMPLIDNVGADGPNLEKFMVLQASKDVLAKYPHSSLPGGIKGWGGVIDAENALKAQLGPERFAKVQDAATQLWKLNDELRLKPLMDEGIISSEQRTALLSSNPHYLPFDRYQYSVDDPSHLLPRTSERLSGANAGIKARTEGGSTLSLDEPLARWMGDIVNTQVVISRNKAARMMVNALQEAEKNTGQKLVVVDRENIARAADLGKTSIDRGAITFFSPKEPGVKQVANVPKIYETVAKGLEAEPANAFTQVMGALATPLRVGATTYSAAFMPVNVYRDIQNAYFREGLSPVSPYYWQGLKAAFAKNADFSEAAQSGVLMSGLLESRKTRDVLRIARNARGITVNSPTDALLVLPRLAAQVPKKILQANEALEQGPRIATYKMLKAQGLSDLEAAVRARDVTVDFSKSGNFVRMLNQMVPFLNARLQGGANIARMVVDAYHDPRKVPVLLMRAAPYAFASIVSWLWNQRFATSNLIPQYEFDRNWVFQIGEGTKAPDPKSPNAPPERFPIYQKIPKGDAAAVVTAPVDAILRLAWNQNDRSVTELFLHAAQAAVQGLAPIDPNSNAVISTLTPPLAQTGYSISANYDFFRNRAIVPMSEANRPPEAQFGPETPKVAVALGQQFHVSPRLIDFAIQNYTGGAGHQAEWLIDLALGALGYNPEAPGGVKQQQLTPIEQAAQLPVASRFLGVRNTLQSSRDYQNLNDAVDAARRLMYQNPEARRFALNVVPVGDTITLSGQQIPLTGSERVLWQQLQAQDTTDALNKLTNSAYYQRLNDAQKRQLIDLTIRRIHQNDEMQMLRSIGIQQIRQRTRPVTSQSGARP